jgi:RNA polymerase sigma-70 factor (ECF subfamily)
VLQVGHGGEVDDPTIGIIGGRVASSIARSVERKRLEETAIVNAMSESITRWKQKGEWTKLKCLELLLVAGLPNREVAEKTGLTEQQVANYKSDFLIRLKSTLTRAGLDSEVFPELQK